MPVPNQVASSPLELIGDTPVVRLARVTDAHSAAVWAKLEARNPGGSVKDRIALAMIEAAAYGLPIIASDHPGNRAYVRNGENGYLVEHGNLAELRDAIVKLTESRNRLATFGLRSREIAGSYTWERVAAQYDSVFRSVIAERKAAAP